MTSFFKYDYLTKCRVENLNEAKLNVMPLSVLKYKFNTFHWNNKG